jgi:hypothetical protein
LPTMPTKRTGAKKLAAYEKYVALPPKIRCRESEGVSIESNATLPTTSNDI